MYNSLLEDDLNRIELRRNLYAYYRPEQQIFVIDGPTVIKVVLDGINPEARVNTRDIKDKLRTTAIDQFNGDITEMLLKMEDLYSILLAEGK